MSVSQDGHETKVQNSYLSEIGEEVRQVIEICILVVPAFCALDKAVQQLIHGPLGRRQLFGYVTFQFQNALHRVMFGHVGKKHGDIISIWFLLVLFQGQLWHG